MAKSDCNTFILFPLHIRDAYWLTRAISKTSRILGIGETKVRNNLIKEGLYTPKAPSKEIPLEDIISGKHTKKYQSNKLRIRLIKAGIFQSKCYKCNNTEWNGEPIPLELEHKDGNNLNNKIENLTILCPNCHAQTPTYRGKNVKAAKAIKEEVKNKNSSAIGIRHRMLITAHGNTKETTNKKCLDCKKPVSTFATRCKSCAGKLQKNKISWPSYEELLQLVESSNYLQAGKKLGVSDSAVRKRLKNHQPRNTAEMR